MSKECTIHDVARAADGVTQSMCKLVDTLEGMKDLREAVNKVFMERERRDKHE